MELDQLDRKDRRALDDTVADLRALQGSALRSVVLYGESVTSSYVPRRSPLTVAVVLDRVTPAALEAIRPYVRKWRRRRVGAPLLLDADFIDAALDVFPLEFLDLADRHLTLHGTDPFADLSLDKPHLRMEIEEQIRGKMVRLWTDYLESSGSARVLERLLTETPASFEIVLRGMLRLRDAARPVDENGLLEGVESAFGVRLPVLRRLVAARTGRRLPRAELVEVFGSYLDEVRALVRVVDGL